LLYTGIFPECVKIKTTLQARRQNKYDKLRVYLIINGMQLIKQTTAYKQHTGHRTVVLGKGYQVNILPET
jgi:hypothetical protein